MSVKVMSWVLEKSASKLADRLVLISIADSANADGGDAWPSVQEISRKSGVQIRSVQRAIVRLVAMGELDVEYGTGPRGRNRYQVLMAPRLDDQETPDTASPRQNVTPDTRSPHPRHTVTPPPTHGHPTPDTVSGSIEEYPSFTRPTTVQQPSNVSELALRDDRDDVGRLCEHLAERIESNGSKKPAITKKWRNSARLLLDKDGRTEQQVHIAIDWCQDSEFWRANVMSMPKLREKYDQMRLQAQRQSGNGDRVATSDQRAAHALTLAEQYRQRGE